MSVKTEKVYYNYYDINHSYMSVKTEKVRFDRCFYMKLPNSAVPSLIKRTKIGSWKMFLLQICVSYFVGRFWSQ